VWTCTSDDAEALVGRLVRAGIRQLREGAGGAIGLDLDQRLTS
jgi:hypothetical protein